jgi:hypothetical protein
MYFFVRTQNPRPTFHLDMTSDERTTMEKVYKVQDEEEMRRLFDHDPAKGLLQYQVLPMPRAVVGVLRD